MVMLYQTEQADLFSMSAIESSKFLPLDISLTSQPNEQVLADLRLLQERELIRWDFEMNSTYGCPVSNPAHLLKCVAYYGDAVNGRYCVGYAIGCINEDRTAIEVDYIEKRCDASEDLRSKFLPIIIDAFAAYGLYLNHIGEANIDKFVLVGPIPGVVGYYKAQGFEHFRDYFQGADAMIKYLNSSS